MPPLDIVHFHHVCRTTTSRATTRRTTPYSPRNRTRARGRCFRNSVHPKSQREDQNPRCDHPTMPAREFTTYPTVPFWITVLKASLRGLFKSYGEVLDVVAHKNLRMRGQAFVSFASTDVAEKAAKEVRGFPLYSRPMVRPSHEYFFPWLTEPPTQQISFAKSRSDAVLNKLDPSALDTHKARRLQHKSAPSLPNTFCMAGISWLFCAEDTRYTNPLKQKFKAKRLAAECRNHFQPLYPPIILHHFSRCRSCSCGEETKRTDAG